MIYTHYFVDLDAVASVWFARKVLGRTDSVTFVSANWDSSALNPTECGATKDDLVLDIASGLKGETSKDGLVLSCFASLVDTMENGIEKEALQILKRYVDLQDSTGNPFAGMGLEEADLEMVRVCSLTSVLNGFKTLHVQDDQRDQTVVDLFSHVLDGIYENCLGHIRARSEADSVTMVAEGLVAIVKDGKEFGTNGILFDRGVSVVVYVDGNNLGLVRSSKVTSPVAGDAVRALVAGEEGWFFHPAGFLACRGSRKAEASSKSKVDPFELAGAAAMDLRTQ